MGQQEQASRTIEITVREAMALQAQGTELLDIRSKQERMAGWPEGSSPLRDPEGEGAFSAVQRRHSVQQQTILLLCERGIRSRELAQTLRTKGITGATSVQGGFEAWQQAGLPVRYPQGLDATQVDRYSRQLVLPEVGVDGQRRLLDASILLIGAGGLGSPAALYLAAAGIGRLGLVDDDLVSRSNLHRQVVHSDSMVGQSKTRSARERLLGLNPDISVETFAHRLSGRNVERTLTGWDLVIDGSDNFPTRYLLNDACLQMEIPLVYGAVMKFEGQVSVFHPSARRGVNPCYRCLFAHPPAAEDAPNCATAGVLGVLPGIIGTLQATEALKWVLGIGKPLIGRLLRIDALEMRFVESRLPADPGCERCAPGKPFPGYVD